MHIVHVFVHVKPECINDFIEATLVNARNSLLEQGIDRFDVIQNTNDDTRFVLCEVYKTAEDALKHKETKHYKAWRDSVANMMDEPRSGVPYKNIFPCEDGWA
jgi:quinol monooxygenase YgiN